MPHVNTYQRASTTEEAANNQENKMTQPADISFYHQPPQDQHDGPINGVENACGPTRLPKSV